MKVYVDCINKTKGIKLLRHLHANQIKISSIDHMQLLPKFESGQIWWPK